jgi:signal transduction histidine kinase/ligand-binding sensor domain-containing protein
MLLLAVGLGLASLVVGRATGATPEWLVRAWQTDEGLPDNNVTGVEQDADGFLWVATLGGLMRFDGTRFEDYSIVHLPKVPNPNVRRMHLDRQNRLWLSLDRVVLIRADARVAKVFTAADGLSEGRVFCIAEDAQGDVWMVMGNAVLRFSGDRVERLDVEWGLPEGGNPWLTADAAGTIWLARGNQLGVLREGRWQRHLTLDGGPLRFVAARGGGWWLCAGERVYRYRAGESPQPVGRLPERAIVRVLLEDQQQRLWVGTAAHGVLLRREEAFEAIPVSHPEILDLHEDREGNLWAGTAGGGLNLLRSQAMTLLNTKAGLPFDSIRSGCEDAAGAIWLVFQDDSLARGRDGRWETLTPNSGWPGGSPNCVTAARGGGVWIGTRTRGLQRWKDGQVREWGRREGLSGVNVPAMLETADGRLWFATEQPSRLHLLSDEGIRSFATPAGTRTLRALAETTDGTLWAGSSDGQLLRLQNDAVVTEPALQADGSRSIRCLYASADGGLWIGFAGWGVGHWRPGGYVRVSSAQGLFDDYVSQMLEDTQGGFWITGNHGLYRVAYRDLLEVVTDRRERVRSIAYGRSEGLPSVQSVCENTPTCWRGRDGRLWFATRKGALVVMPERIAENPTPPPVRLTGLRVDDRLLARAESHRPLRPPAPAIRADLKDAQLNLELPPDHEKLEFEFAGLSFASPENVHFRYRLRGFDQKWVEAGAVRNARYPRLPAGAYRFEVTACNETGVWNSQPAFVAFGVQPFFWQTWWFRAGVGLSFTGCVVGLVRFFSFRRLRLEVGRLERQAELQRERTRIARDMHDEVGTKLSRLSLLSEITRQQPELPPAAQSEVAEISDTAREAIRSFEEIVWAVNPKNDSLAQLVHYLCRFAEDFFEGSGTQCVFDLPDEIPALALSTETRHHVFLATKEALNNVLKHARARTVAVRLRVNAGGFELRIEDDGIGFDPAAGPARTGGGNGLGNMRERMRLAHGEIELRSAPGQGTGLRFVVPVTATLPA